MNPGRKPDPQIPISGQTRKTFFAWRRQRKLRGSALPKSVRLQVEIYRDFLERQSVIQSASAQMVTAGCNRESAKRLVRRWLTGVSPHELWLRAAERLGLWMERREARHAPGAARVSGEGKRQLILPCR